MAQHQTVQHPMTVDEFFEWLTKQDQRYELVNGHPLMMSGANIAHDTIVMNASRVFGNQLLDKPCRPRSADIAVKIPAGNIRYPDLSVDCGEFHRKDHYLDKPTLVIEVASPSTKKYDDVDKLDEYKTIPSMEYILLVETDIPCIRFYSKIDDDKWEKQIIVGMRSSISLPIIGASISMEDLYKGLDYDIELENDEPVRPKFK